MSVAYDPNKQGWGAAVVTCVCTAGLLFGAYSIHKDSYRHPRDPMNRQVYHAADSKDAKNGPAESPAAAGADAKH